MQSSTRHRQAKRFVASPYVKGLFIREDIFWRRFVVHLDGEIHYRNLETPSGTHRQPTKLHVSRHGFIEEAMMAAETTVANATYPLGDGHGDAIFFTPGKALIRDLLDRLVLSGDAVSGSILWHAPTGAQANHPVHPFWRPHASAAISSLKS